VPELNTSIYAQRGFNIIATANNRDKGVNELSSALKRRFNVVVLPLPEDMAEEVSIVSRRVGEMASGLDLPVQKMSARRSPACSPSSASCAPARPPTAR